MDEHRSWAEIVAEDPGHSTWYVERFRALAAAGEDLAGEARMLDAMLARGSRVLDAGCGSGRVGGLLAEAGHEVIGVDLDPVLIAAAEQDHPGPLWLVADLAQLDLAAHGIAGEFDLVFSAGNVMTFVSPEQRRHVVGRLADHLAASGRLVVGFGSGRGYDFGEFLHDCRDVGLAPQLLLASWDLRPLQDDSDFLVAVLGRV